MVEQQTHDALSLRWNEPLAVEITALVQRGQADRVRHMLERHPGLARARIVKDGESAGSRTLLHLFADWPGHRRNPGGIVTVLHDGGADLDAPIEPPVGRPSEAGEAPLHWAASNDDVELADALLDAGADIEARGSVFGGGAPISDAVNCAGWRTARRLVERGARTNIYQSAALGLVDRVEAALAADPGPDAERITQALWAACLGGQRNTAAILLARGADINWVGWGGGTPLDLARQNGSAGLALWLERQGARSGSDIGGEP